jgi:WhiB family transcriptional regulator, redox-sensing transcriptional regulator
VKLQKPTTFIDESFAPERRVVATHERPGLRTPLSWVERAACRTADPELFFPLSGHGPGAQQIEQARAVCARCAIRAACLDWSVTNAVVYGVWGGLSEDERRSLVRQRQRA